MHTNINSSDLSDFVFKAKSGLLSFMEEVGMKTPPDPSVSCSQLETFCESFIENKKTTNTIELPDSLPTNFFANPGVAITIDSNTIRQILKPFRKQDGPTAAAVSADEYLTLYTPEERNALYEYAVRHTTKIQVPPELFLEPEEKTVAEDESSEETYDQKILRLQKERDFKRRRQAYRRKVSTKNKSYVEVAREIISNYMEAISDQANVKEEIKSFSNKNLTTSVTDDALAGTSGKVIKTEAFDNDSYGRRLGCYSRSRDNHDRYDGRSTGDGYYESKRSKSSYQESNSDGCNDRKRIGVRNSRDSDRENPTCRRESSCKIESREDAIAESSSHPHRGESRERQQRYSDRRKSHDRESRSHNRDRRKAHDHDSRKVKSSHGSSKTDERHSKHKKKHRRS